MVNIYKFLTLKSETKFLEDNFTVRQALEKMEYYRYSVIPILNNEGKYVGTLSEGDLLHFIKNDCDFDIKKGEDTKLKDIKRYRNYLPLLPNSTNEEIIRLAVEQNFIPVVDDRNIFVGIIRRKTILELLKDDYLIILNKITNDPNK